jgi:hypothetical protein
MPAIEKVNYRRSWRSSPSTEAEDVGEVNDAYVKLV